MNLIVIYNSKAGDAKWTKQRVADLLVSAGHTVEMTSRKRKWRDLMSETPDAFVAAGGDGTVHKVIRELDGRDIPVAILPTGTANNVAHSLGYHTTNDWAERVANWSERGHIVQLARVQRGEHQDICIEATGIGVFADMVRKSVELRDKPPAPVSILNIRRKLVQKLLKAKPVRVGLTIDGTQVEREFLLVECLNMSYYGPRLRLVPDIIAHQPKLALCAFDATNREAAAQWISTGEGDPGEWVLGYGSTIEIASKRPAHVDGDEWPRGGGVKGPLEIQAGVRSVRVWV